MCLDAGSSQDSVTGIQEQLHQADSPSVESYLFTANSHYFDSIKIYNDNMTVFIISGVVYLITAIAYILIRNVRKDCKCLKVIWMVDIAYFIGGLFYYFGRNFPILARLFQNGGSCQNSIQIIQSILLGFLVRHSSGALSVYPALHIKVLPVKTSQRKSNHRSQTPVVTRVDSCC